MKILYANPLFLYYRIPYYKRLNELFGGEFYVLYSVNRYKQRTEWVGVLDKIPEALGDNAIPYDREKVYDTYTKSFSKCSYEQGGKKIPFPVGLFSLIRKQKPDVLITEGFFQWTPLILLYGFLFKKPVFIGYERTCYTERNVSWILKIHRKISNWFVKGYIVNGTETTKYLETLGIKRSKIFVGGMSADGKMLQDNIASFPIDEKLQFKSKFMSADGILFLFTGKLCERKGVSYLLSAWCEHIKKYPNDILILVGAGDLGEVLKEKYALIDSIKFVGAIPYSDIYKYYAIADVFVIPTIEDNWSLVVPEAMSCGLPVATSIYNGCHTDLIYEGENGITFDTFQQDSIVKALDFFHHHDLNYMGEKSKQIETYFNTENSAQRTFDAIVSQVKTKD